MPNLKTFRAILLSVIGLSIGIVFATQLSIVKSEGKTENTNLKPIQTDEKRLLSKQSSNNLLTTFLPSPSPTPDETPHTLVGSFYTLRNGFKSTLLLNNKGIQPIEVSPTLYAANGLEFQIPTVTVPASQGILIDMQDWVNLAGEQFRSGNLKLFHLGKDLVVGAQIYIEDLDNGLSFDEKLAEIGKFDSRRLEGIWYQPEQSTKVKIVLSNTTTQPLSVSAKLTRLPNITGVTETISLNPNETKLFDLQEDFADGSQFANFRALALSLEHTGDKSALVARTMVFNRQNGYSNTVQFSNPLTGKSNQYHGAGLRLKIGNQKLEPIVVARNTSETSANLTGRVPYTRNNGTTGIVNLPNVRLRPNEIKLLDMSAVISRNEQENIKIAGIEFEYDTPEGSVQITTHSVSQDFAQVFRVPMYDPLVQKSPTGGYPFRIEENSSTRAYLKNISNQEQDYVAFLLFGGMRYMIGLKTLKPKQTVEIDFKKLRDQQIPDERGNTIPLSVTSGQFQWTLRKRSGISEVPYNLDDLAIVGRSEQIDTTHNISSNYACQNCCIGSYAGGLVIPNPESVIFEQGRTVQFRVFILETTCYTDPYEYEIYQPIATWSSSNTSVATISGGGLASVVGAGQTSISASFFASIHLSYPCSPGPIPFSFEIGKNWISCLQDDGNKQRGPNVSESGMVSTNLLLPGCGVCYGAYFLTSLPSSLEVVDPQVTIASIDWVEKNVLKSTTVSITNARPTDTTTFSIRTNNGTTGSATFENGSSQVSLTGNISNQELKIKGITESNQVDNIIIEAKVAGSNTIRASDNFTVAAITSLVFERINTTGTNPDVPLDNNPGNGQPNTNAGQRIFPDKNTPTDTTDRAILRVKATVAPANIPNLKVFFASFDLDDPSANAAPIDTNANNGNDNNGNVNMSLSGEFSSATGVTCANASTGTSGTTPPYISKIECPVTNNTTSANFKVTMQPGDNFAVAASLDSAYRTEIHINTSAGANLINNANQIIPISGEANPNNVQGIRTKMLTVWRRLHIEVDSMGNVRENYVTGTVTNATSIPRGRSDTLNLSVSNLEVNRFENGRVEVGASAGVLSVTSNTDNTVTVTNNTANNITVANNANFNITNNAGNRTVAGTIPTGATITPMQSVILTVNSTPLGANTFQNGTMTLISALSSLSVTINTANSIDVTNNGTTTVQVIANSIFRLYDDDDMNDDDGTNLDGDSNEDIDEPTPDTTKLVDTNTPCNSTVLSGCNTFAPAYIIPKYDLTGSHNNTTYYAHIQYTTTSISDILSNRNGNMFDNYPTEASLDFWTIYLLGAYQGPGANSPTPDEDGDPVMFDALGRITTNYGVTNRANRQNDGSGSILYTETSRATEYPSDYATRPVSRAYTTVHEIGHLFRSEHIDGDLMTPTSTRTVGTFSDASLDWIRKTTYP